MPEAVRAYVVAVDPAGTEVSQRIPGALHTNLGAAAITFRPDTATPADIELDVAAGTIVADVPSAVGRRTAR